MPLQSRIRSLDGVRALAALWVMLGHLCQFYHSTFPGPIGWLVNWVYYPRLAVDVFIVLSGYCLTLPTLSTGTLRGTVGQFYAGRARRILPPLYASVALGLLFVLASARFGRSGTGVQWSAIVGNLALLHDWWSSANTLNFVTWSVAVEFKIYLLFPLLLLFRRRLGIPAMLGVAAAIGYGVMAAALLVSPGKNMDFAAPWLLFLFAMGCASGELAHRPTAPRRAGTIAWLILLLSAAATVAIVAAHPTIAGDDADYVRHVAMSDPFMGLAAAALLFLLNTGRFRAGARVAEGRWLVYVGTISYSLYLVHLVILDAVRAVVLRVHFAGGSATLRLLATAAIGLPAVAIGTVLFFQFVERPFLRHRKPERIERLAVDAVASPAP